MRAEPKLEPEPEPPTSPKRAKLNQEETKPDPAEEAAEGDQAGGSRVPWIALSNGAKMPPIGLGLYLLEDGPETEEIVLEAISQGYRLLDGAAFYNNEAACGRALKRSSVPRAEIIVTSKVWTTDRTFEDAVASMERSHAELGSEPIDIGFVHWPVPGAHVDMYCAMQHCVERGLIRSIGISNYLPSDYEELKQSGRMTIPPVVNQFEASPFLNRPSLVEYFHGQGIAVQATKPLQRGACIEHPTVLRIAEEMNVTPAQLLLRYGMQRGFCVLCKSRNPERLRENLVATELPSLSAGDMAELDKLTSEESIAKFEANWDKRRHGTPAPWGDGPRPRGN